MTKTSDPDEFERKWNSYVEDLEGIKSNLPQQRYEELDELIEELKVLIRLATRIFEGKACWNCEKEIGGEEQERCGHCGVPV